MSIVSFWEIQRVVRKAKTTNKQRKARKAERQNRLNGRRANK